jgi:hypothetical protein
VRSSRSASRFCPAKTSACAKDAVSKLAATTLAFAGDSPAEAAPPDRWYHADAAPLSNKRRRSSAQRRSVLGASRLLALGNVNLKCSRANHISEERNAAVLASFSTVSPRICND